MDITFYAYTPEGILDKLGIIDDFSSFNFERTYNEIGEWQITLDGNSLNAQQVKGAEIISANDGVAGLVQECVESIDEDGQYIIIYRGLELKAIAQNHIIYPPTGEAYQSYTNVSPEYVIAQLITKHIINPVNTIIDGNTILATNRVVSGTLADYTESEDNIDFSGRFDNVAESIIKICALYNIGWYADIQSGAIVWHIYKGVDRRKSQSTNSKMKVSYDLDSFGKSQLNNTNFIPNVALVCGQGEGTNRAVSIVGAASGLKRSEVYIDARDIEDDAALPLRGLEKLAEYGDSQIYEATFSEQFINQYRKPFDVGDIGTIEDNRLPDGEIDFILSKVEEVYEDDNFSLTAVFGYSKNNDIKSAIKRSTGNTESLISNESSGLNTSAIVNLIYPVGAIYMSVVNTSPSVLFGGTWATWGTGRAPVGIDASQTEFDTIEKTGGVKTHALTVSEMPSHTHVQDQHTHTQNPHSHVQNVPNGYPNATDTRPMGLKNDSSGSPKVPNMLNSTNNTLSSLTSISTADTTPTNQNATPTNQNTGGGTAHTNLQPYITCYMWKRTA